MSVDAKKFLENLCDLEVPGDLHISPNGQQVVYTTSLEWGHAKGKTPVSTIWLADLDKENSARKLTSGRFKDHSPRWTPDGEGIFFLSDRAKPDEQWAIYSLSLKQGGEAFQLTPQEATKEIAAFEISPDGKSIAYVSVDEKTKEQASLEEKGEDVHVWGEDFEYARLRTIDIESKQVKTLTAANTRHEEKHVQSLAWRPDGTEIVFSWVKSSYDEEPWFSGVNLSTIDIRTGTIKDHANLKGALQGLTWGEDGKIYFFAGIPLGSEAGGQAVWSFDPSGSSNTCTNTAFGVDSDVQDLRSLSGHGLIAILAKNMSAEIATLDGKVLFTREGDINHFAASKATSSNNITLAITSSDINHPEEVFSVIDGELTKLSTHGHAFREQTFGTVRTITCRGTDDKEDLYALHITPHNPPTTSSTTSTPAPTFVLIHGGPFDRCVNSFNANYYYFVPGLLHLNPTTSLLLPNYRGSSGRGTRFASYSIGGVGEYDHSDVLALTTHAVRSGLADPNKLVVGGYSQGGFLSNLCATRNGIVEQQDGGKWSWKAAVPMAGVCDTDTMTLTSDMGGSAEEELNVGKMPWTVEKGDTTNRKASALWEVAEAMERVKNGGVGIPPVLILHGEADKRCPIDQAVGMRRALRHAGVECEYVTYPRQDHGFREQKFWIDMVWRLSNFLKKHLDG